MDALSMALRTASCDAVKFIIAGTLSAIMTATVAIAAAVQFGIITPTYSQSGATSSRILRLRIAERT